MNPGALDGRVLDWVVEHRTPWATSVANHVMEVGTTPRCLALLAVMGLVVVIAFRAWWVALAVVGAVAAASVAVGILKHLIGRARPPFDLAVVHLHTYSMPSGEAARTAAAATALIVTVTWTSRRLMWMCAVVLAFGAAFVGACMVYLGGHWVTDLLVGWILGVAIGLAVGMSVRRLAGRRALRPAAETVTA